MKATTARALKENPRVIFAYIFGSVARGTQTPFSDIDIAVYFSEGADLVSEKLNLLGKLIDNLETDDLDLVVLNTAPLPLQARVLRDKEIMVDRNPHFRHIFESLIIRKYLDFSIEEEAILRRRFGLGG
jgi:predicted nucleotidyltransferase